MDKDLMKKYAEFIVRVGVNVAPGQTLLIHCPVEAAFFGRECAAAAFAAGAADVVMKYSDEKFTRLRMENASEETLCEVKPHLLRSYLDYAESEGGACVLNIHADDPNALQGLDAGRLNRVSLARRRALEPWQQYTMYDRIQWCVVAIPTPAWACTVFPGLDAREAVEKLWALIFKVCRITADTDPVAVWRAHTARMSKNRDKLNALGLDAVRLESANGTDLTIGLADGHVWEAAASVAENGVPFIPNIPTEEVFTAPHRLRVNGTVKGSKPYVYNGQLIEGFSVTFRDGRVVAHSAEKNDGLLAELLASDEGAAHIGEIALVPASSPINRSGVLFYNTLFDENAACHIAFGAGYPGTVKGGAKMDRAQLLQLGVNDSAVHEDVMVGTEDMTITGICKDGRTVTIFKGGEWAL